jgi:hypothetical protein
MKEVEENATGSGGDIAQKKRKFVPAVVNATIPIVISPKKSKNEIVVLGSSEMVMYVKIGSF